MVGSKVVKKEKVKKPKIILTVGKRKKAVARAIVKEGKGIIRFNKVPIQQIQPRLLRLKMLEPVKLAEGIVEKVNIDVNTIGGGLTGQVSAARQAIAKGLVAWSKDKNLKKKFIDYDRNLLIYDPRRTEPHKFSRSSKGARRKRQLSKR